MKNILIKYLSLEAIENTITSLYYKVDGIVFLGRQNIINEEKSNITSFLKNFCSTEVLNFINIERKSIEDIVSIINSYKNGECRYFLDLTGSNGLFSAASIACSKNYPLSIFDIKENRIVNIETKYKCDYSIDDIEKRHIKLNISTYIDMIGGKIVNDSQNTFKQKINNNVIELRNNHKDTWNYFSNIINKSINNSDSLTVYCKDLKPLLNEHITNEEFEIILNEANNKKLVKKVHFDKVNSKIKSFTFEFVNDNIKHLIKNTGSVFEQIVYLDNKKDSTDCMISVSLDWDGEISESGQPDIRNEIDVIRLDDLIVTFISCKNREVKKEDIYELESIARNFAGNYVQMIIATPYIAKKEVELRAKELGVTIKYYD